MTPCLRFATFSLNLYNLQTIALTCVSWSHSSHMCCPLRLKAALEQLAVFIWEIRVYPSSEMACQTITRRIKKKTKHEFSLSLCLSRYIYFPFLCSLSGVWLPYDNPDWSSCSSQLFLFNYITDWDINLRFATTVPGVGEGSL